MIAGKKVNVGTGIGFQRETIVLTVIPFAYQVGNIIVVPGVVGFHILVVQGLISQRRGIGVRDGSAAPVAQNLLQINGSFGGRRSFSFYAKGGLGNIVRRINRRQIRRQELDIGSTGAPGGMVIRDDHIGGIIQLNRGRFFAGDKVIFNSGRMVLGDDSRIQNDRELRALHPFHIGNIRHTPGKSFFRRRYIHIHAAEISFNRCILHKGTGQRESNFTGRRNDLNRTIRLLFRNHIRHREQERQRTNAFSRIESEVVFEVQGLDRTV